MKTKGGKDIFIVGHGVCGKIIVQVKMKDGIWKLGKTKDLHSIEMFGHEGLYEVDRRS